MEDDPKDLPFIDDIPVTEIAEDQLSPSNPSENILWEQLSDGVPFYFSLINRLLMISYQIDNAKSTNRFCINSISSGKFFLFFLLY